MTDWCDRYVRVTADLAEARRDRAEIGPRSARDRTEIAQARLEDRIRDGALVAVIAYSAENWTV